MNEIERAIATMRMQRFLNPRLSDFYETLATIAARAYGRPYETPEDYGLAAALGRLQPDGWEAEVYRIGWRALLDNIRKESGGELADLAAEYFDNDNHLPPAKMTRLLRLVEGYKRAR